MELLTVSDKLAIYIDADLQRLTDSELDALIASFPEQRRGALLAYRNAKARRQGALAYHLLCRALNERYGISPCPPFAYGSHGKPTLSTHPGIQFNLSHCSSAVACGIGSEPVGIDIEDRNRMRGELVRRVMNEREVADIAASADPDLRFTQLWTRKEALLKLTGRGLVADLRDVLTDSHFLLTTHTAPSYVLSVARYPRG